MEQTKLNYGWEIGNKNNNYNSQLSHRRHSGRRESVSSPPVQPIVAVRGQTSTQSRDSRAHTANMAFCTPSSAAYMVGTGSGVGPMHIRSNIISSTGSHHTSGFIASASDSAPHPPAPSVSHHAWRSLNEDSLSKRQRSLDRFEALPQMMEQLGRQLSDQQQAGYQHRSSRHHHISQQQQQQRRILPQIPHPQSPPSDLHQPYQQPSKSHIDPYYGDSGQLEESQVALHRSARHRHRRQSSLELERRQQQQFGFPDYDKYSEPYQVRPHAHTQPVAGVGGSYGGQQARVPPTISISPEFPVRDAHLGADLAQGGEFDHNNMYNFHQRTPKQPQHAEGVDALNLYQQQQAYQKSSLPQYYSSHHNPHQHHHQQAQFPHHQQLPHHRLHHHHHHHHLSHNEARSMAMGSDSELNTRGLSSNKLYYVHVPSSRRSRHSHHRQQPQSPVQMPEQAHPPPNPLQATSQHQMVPPSLVAHQMVAPTIPASDYNTQDEFANLRLEPSLIEHQRRPTTYRSQPVVSMPEYSSLHRQMIQPGSRESLEQQQYLQQQQQQQQQLAQSVQHRPAKGVTFDGRISAPVYGRRKKETREKYLRTNSEEYAAKGAETCPGRNVLVDKAIKSHLARDSIEGDVSAPEESEDKEEGSSSIASRASNASYSGLEHYPNEPQQHQQQHQAGTGVRGGVITASEFNLSGMEYWPPSQHEDSRQRLSSHEGSHELSQTTVPGKDRRISRGPEFPNFSSQQEQPLVSERHARRRRTSPKHQYQQQHHQQPITSLSYHETDSFSDTGLASTFSDKDIGSQGATATFGGGSGADIGSGTSPSKSERRHRVRDQQHSSNERSIGDGGGSSQSLKSQSGGISGSGQPGLSKKSNSTTQLSLSGKFERVVC